MTYDQLHENDPSIHQILTGEVPVAVPGPVQYSVKCVVFLHMNE